MNSAELRILIAGVVALLVLRSWLISAKLYTSDGHQRAERREREWYR